MDKVTTAQIHPEIARSKLLRTDKQTDGKHPPVFCRLAHQPVARSIFWLGTLMSRQGALFKRIKSAAMTAERIDPTCKKQ